MGYPECHQNLLYVEMSPQIISCGDTCVDRKTQRDFFFILVEKSVIRMELWKRLEFNSGWRFGKGWNLIQGGDLERAGI